MAMNPRRNIEDLARLYGWDDELTGLAASLHPTALPQLVSNLASSDLDGWTFVLPKLPADATVLCFDARFGTTAIALSEWAREVIVVHPCRTTVAIIEYRLRLLDITNVRVLHVSPESKHLPFDVARFDAVIHHDVTGFLLKDPASADWVFSAASAPTADEAHRVLREGGFLYCGVRNPLGYAAWKSLLRGRLRDFFAQSSRRQRIRGLRRAYSRSGFDAIRAHPYLLTQEHVCEVLPEGGYKSAKNSLLFRERLKEMLLGQFGVRHLAPAYGFVAAKGNCSDTLVASIADDLIANRLMDAEARSRVRFLRYIVLPGKSFITLGECHQSHGNIVAVIPRYPRFIDGRRKELAIVDDLRSTAPRIGGLLPAAYKELSLSGRPYFAMSEIKGITVDCAMPAVAALTRNALDFLISFHKTTARFNCVDEDAYARLFGTIIDRARQGYPDLSPQFDRIDGLVRKAVVGETILTCWLHGDYKLENLIFDSDSLAITGVIDWEHSRKEGLPWLDFLYLVTYNRITKDEGDFFSVFQNTLLNQRFTDFESSLLRTYADAVPIRQSLRTPLIAMFFLHHIAFRYKYNMSRATDRNNLLTSLALISGALVSCFRSHCHSGSA